VFITRAALGMGAPGRMVIAGEVIRAPAFRLVCLGLRVRQRRRDSASIPTLRLLRAGERAAAGCTACRAAERAAEGLAGSFRCSSTVSSARVTSDRVARPCKDS
jgi:hypothetical protein